MVRIAHFSERGGPDVSTLDEVEVPAPGPVRS